MLRRSHAALEAVVQADPPLAPAATRARTALLSAASDRVTDTVLGFLTVGLARGINSPNYAPGEQGLASANPVFGWVRLAQRLAVHIQIDTAPGGVLLSAEETATVSVGPLPQTAAHGWHGSIARLFSNLSPPLWPEIGR